MLPPMCVTPSGMDTRFNRLDNGMINWYNVDLENSANYRLKYIEDTDRVTTLAYSAMDSSWAEEIKIRNDWEKQEIYFNSNQIICTCENHLQS